MLLIVLICASLIVSPVYAVPPVVDDIPDQTVLEGGSFATIALDDFVTDVETADADIVWSYFGNTDLTVSITDRVATISIPDGDWNGAETITFTATDLDDETASDAATFTVTPVNDLPVVADIPNQSIAEGGSFTTINLNDYVSDVETADVDIVWTYNVLTNLTVNIVNQVATIGVVDANWNGTETITFTATDLNGGTDSDPADFTVTPVNDLPVVADIPNQSIAEGGSFTTINLNDYVSDVETADVDIVWTHNVLTNLTVNIVNQVATIGVVDANWNGTETITFTATDLNGGTDSDPADFTVTPVNDLPVVTDIPNQSIAEGGSFTTINLNNYVSDVETADVDIVWTHNVLTNLTVNIVNQVATIGVVDANWNGTETITFTATDLNGGTDSDPADFTVTPVNDLPVVTDIPNQSIAEGGSFTTINLNNFVSDVETADVDIVWTHNVLTNLTVNIVNQVATIGVVDANWNGTETITFTATDLNGGTDSDPADFTVTPENDLPVVIDIPNQSIAEGGSFTTINLNNYVSDVETADANIVWTYNVLTNLTVNIVNQVATIGVVDANWNGTETITFTATDLNGGTGSDPATFTVISVNDAPVGTSGTVTALEDVPFIITAAAFGFTDPLDIPANLYNRVDLVTLPVLGTLKLNGVAITTVPTTVTKTDLDANKLTYTSALNGHGTTYASFTFKVGDDGGTTNGGVSL